MVHEPTKSKKETVAESEIKILTNAKDLRVKSVDVEVGEYSEIELITNLLLSGLPSNAIGLALPQLGVYKRAFYADLSAGRYIFINPQCICDIKSPIIPSVESCLSCPGITRCINRYTRINMLCDVALMLNTEGVVIDRKDKHEMMIRNFDAFVVQHENDHLDGILIIDHRQVPTPQERALMRQAEREKKLKEKRLKKKPTRMFEQGLFRKTKSPTV